MNDTTVASLKISSLENELALQRLSYAELRKENAALKRQVEQLKNLVLRVNEARRTEEWINGRIAEIEKQELLQQ